jgi:hypothetical protein
MVVPPKQKSHLGGVLLFLILLAGVAYAAWHFYGAQIQARIAVFTHPVAPVQPVVQVEPTPPVAEGDAWNANSTQSIPQAPPDPYAEGTPAYAAIQTLIAQATKTPTDQPITISQRADVTGDSISELLVTNDPSGIGGQYYVVRFENDKSILARAKYTAATKVFSALSATADAGRKSDSVQLLSEQQTILATSYSVYGVPKDYCLAIAYVWNPVTKVFEYNKTISDQKTQDMMPQCLQIATDTNVTYKGTTSQ